MCRWPVRAPTPILWPIIDPISVTFGQLCNFRDPNLVTFYFYELTHFLDWMKNTLHFRLFTVLYFSVKWARSRALRYGLPSCMSVKATWGAGAVWFGGLVFFSSPSPASPYSYNPRRPPPRYIWKSRWPPLTVRRAISRRSHEKIGDCGQSR